MTEDQVIEKLSQRFRTAVHQWLYEDGPSEVSINGRVFTLCYDDRYEVYESNQLLAWNDNHQDFLSIYDSL